MGIMAPPVAALFAVSGPATPAIAPFPNCSHEEPDDRSPDHGPERFLQVFKRRQNLEETEIRLYDLQGRTRFEVFDHLAQAEHPDGDRKKVDAVEEFLETEGEPRLAGHDILSHHGQHQPQAGGDQTADDRFASKGDYQAQSHDHEGKIFGGSQHQGRVRKRRSESYEPDHACRAADERADRRDPQSDAGLALPGHRIAVEHRHHRCGLARYAHQDRGDRTAVLCPVKDAGEHDQRRHGFHLERRRQEDSAGARRADARKRAHRCADDNANGAKKQVDGRQGNGQSMEH
jgi:hypothetical protein